MAIIYRIRHSLSGMSYVGSTKRQKGRFREHWIALERREHHAPHLQDAWNKYGPEAFVWEILETCEDAAQFIREQWWIDNTEASLNSSRLAVGGKLPDFGERMSRATKGKPQSASQQLAKRLNLINGQASNPANKPGWVPAHLIGTKNTPETIEQRRASRLATEAARREQGLRYVWITDGVKGQKVLDTDPFPDGWRLGRQPAYSEKQRHRRGETRDEAARENMRQAQLATNAARRAAGEAHHNTGVQQRYCWITDGATAIRHLKSVPIPDGFRRGRK